MTTIPWLDMKSMDFPDPSTALDEPNGLLAVGGDLSADRLVASYRQGIFPWYEDPQPILWWSPSPRAVLFPKNVNISRSMRKLLRRREYTVSCDAAFNDVVSFCGNIPRDGQHGTWITPEMKIAYQKLHHRGVAHSVEVWHQGQLVGGLYGLAIGQVFFGESMFSKRTNASKIAFIYLAQFLSDNGFALIDCQVSNPHLFSLGAEEITRQEFSGILSKNIDKLSTIDWDRLNTTTFNFE